MVNWFRVLLGIYYSNVIDNNLKHNVRLAEKLGKLSTKCTDRELQLISK